MQQAGRRCGHGLHPPHEVQPAHLSSVVTNVPFACLSPQEELSQLHFLPAEVKEDIRTVRAGSSGAKRSAVNLDGTLNQPLSYDY